MTSCTECGAIAARFQRRRFSVDYAGSISEVAGLSGWECTICHEIEFDAESAHLYAAAGDNLVLKARLLQAEELRRIRKRLRLSQKAAANLTGGGHNAFSRYERGEATPVAAVMNLFRLLDRHPNLLHELAASPMDASAR